jgi:hypothetical protein
MISLADVFSRSACIRSSVHKSSSMTIVGVVGLTFSPPFFPLAILYYLTQYFSGVKGGLIFFLAGDNFVEIEPDIAPNTVRRDIALAGLLIDP